MTAHNPLVSVIIPAYQAAYTIEKTLRSLLAQSDPRWRAIVVNDGSTDQTVQAVCAFNDPRITLHTIDHAGVSSARNFGFSLSKEPFVCFLDADDTLDPAYMGLMIPAATNQTLGATCGYRYVNNAQTEIHCVPPAPTRTLSLDTLLCLDPPAIMSFLHNRNTLDLVAKEGHLFDPTMCSFEDWDMLRRVGIVQPGAWAPVMQPLASYHCSHNSLSSNIERSLQTGLDLIALHGKSHPQLDTMLRQHRLKHLAASIVEKHTQLTQRILHTLGTIDTQDALTLASAIQWHTMRRSGLGESALARQQSEIQTCIQDILADSPALPFLLNRIKHWKINPWADALERAQQAIGPKGRVVIFGLGRNGLQAVSYAQLHNIECVVVDDDPDRVCADFSKIPACEIIPNDAVLLTPDAHQGIADRLKARGIHRIITRDDPGRI